MTEFDYIEVVQANLEFIRSAAMDFTTVFFAYAITAHLVGKSLTKPIAMLISVIYTLFLLGPFTGILGTMNTQLDFLYEAKRLFPESVFFASQVGSTFIVLAVVFVPLAAAWVASLFYMHGYLRR